MSSHLSVNKRYNSLKSVANSLTRALSRWEISSERAHFHRKSERGRAKRNREERLEGSDSSVVQWRKGTKDGSISLEKPLLENPEC